MTWQGILLGFGLGFAAAAYIFSGGVRSRVHAVIRGMWSGSPQPKAKPRTAPKQNSQRNNRKKRKCCVCGEFGYEDEMDKATINKSPVWLHSECQDKLTEVKSSFDYTDESGD